MLGQLQNSILHVVSLINVYLSDYILVFLLVGVGLWQTIKTRFVQVRCFGESFRNVFGDFSLSGKKHESGMSSFQALATAVAAQVGTGCIVGAAGAILTGGPGAIFWMWIISFFGMATNYAEATLAQKTRIVDEDGTVKGGPVYYILYRFKGSFGKVLAGFFAVAAFLELGIMGGMVQSNSIAECFQTAFGVPKWVAGIVLVVLCGFVCLGGVRRLAAVAEKIVPVMASLFLLGAFVVLIVKIRHVPDTFVMIFKYAFVPQAIIGGGFGSALKIAVSQGVKRGLFSNEAGLGSTPHAHALANVERPHDQGCVAMFGVFVDSFVILTICALVIISATYTPGGILERGYVGEVAQTVSKTNLAQFAFSSVMGATIGTKFVAVCLLFFAFSTILSWNLFGKINSVYLFGKKFTPAYSTIALVFIFIGCVTSNDLVWEIADMLNNLMAIPNAIALFALTGVVAECAGVKKK